MNLEKKEVLKIQVFIIAFILICSSIYLHTPTFGAENPPENDHGEIITRFAVIGDPHVSIARKKNNEALRNAVKEINSNDNIEFVMISGDLVDWASKQNWRMCEQIIENLEPPVFPTVGNHDYRDTIFDVLYPGVPFSNWKIDNSGLEYYFQNLTPKENKNFQNSEENWNLEFGPTPGDYKFDQGPLHIVVLDSGHDSISKTEAWLRGNGLHDSQIRWLEQTIREEENIFISMHHTPVFEFENKKMKGLFQNVDNFLSLTQSKDVKSVLSGHIHINSESKIDNANYISTSDPPTYRILEFNSDGTINTEIMNQESVGQFKESRVTADQVWRGIQWSHLNLLSGRELLTFLSLIFSGIIAIGYIVISSRQKPNTKNE